jgi:hypothetical protein
MITERRRPGVRYVPLLKFSLLSPWLMPMQRNDGEGSAVRTRMSEFERMKEPQHEDMEDAKKMLSF